MLPSDDQIKRAAYDRWLRRGQVHGCDREDWHAAEDELTFSLNYRTIVDYPLDAAGSLVVGDRPGRSCRLCERTSAQVAFSVPRPNRAGRGSDEPVDAQRLRPMPGGLPRAAHSRRPTVLEFHSGRLPGQDALSRNAHRASSRSPSSSR